MTRRHCLPLVACLSLLGVHCSDSSDPAQPAPTPSDEGFPAPTIGGQPALDALADAPARCGQPEHQWLRDATLGEVRERVVVQSLPASVIEALVEAEEATAPREIVYDTVVEQVRYVTQDRGKLLEATTLVAYPVVTERVGQPTPPIPSEPMNMLVVLHGTAGFSDACAPSLDSGTRAFAALFASMGYLVIAPDYIGLKGSGEPTGFAHPYLVGQPTAIASLDAVRAAGRMPWEEINQRTIQPRFAVVGGSQGGHAALWVDRLAPYYAPELALLGVVATVPLADMIGQATRALLEPVPATANTVAFLSVAPAWYGAGDRLNEVFTAQAAADIAQAFDQDCSGGDVLDNYTTLESLFTPSLLQAAAQNKLAELPLWGCITAENGLTTTSIARQGPSAASYGLLWVLGQNDALVHTPLERQSFETLCAQGMPMQFLECEGAGHVETTLWALPEIMDFVDDRFAGRELEPSRLCQITAATRCRGTPAN